jgi:thioesterase domain-containing protein
MAQQLAAAGEQVAFLGNLDGLLKRNLPFSKKLARLLYQAKLDWAAMRDHGLASYLFARLRARTLRFVYSLYSAAERPAPRSLESVSDIHWFAVGTYRPRVYPERLVLFRTNDEDSMWDPALGWRGLAAGGIEIYELPGNHYDVFDGPSAEQLAHVIERKLSRHDGS